MSMQQAKSNYVIQTNERKEPYIKEIILKEKKSPAIAAPSSPNNPSHVFIHHYPVNFWGAGANKDEFSWE